MVLLSIILANENAYGQILRGIQQSIERGVERAVEREISRERQNTYGNNLYNNGYNQGGLSGEYPGQAGGLRGIGNGNGNADYQNGGNYPIGGGAYPGGGGFGAGNGFGGPQVGFGGQQIGFGRKKIKKFGQILKMNEIECIKMINSSILRWDSRSRILNEIDFNHEKFGYTIRYFYVINSVCKIENKVKNLIILINHEKKIPLIFFFEL